MYTIGIAQTLNLYALVCILYLFIFLFFFLFFFEGMTDLGKKRKARIVKKIWVENQKVNLILSVYLGVLPILKEYVMVFQVSIFLYSVCNST